MVHANLGRRSPPKAIRDPETCAFLYPIAVAVFTITTLLTPSLIKSADGVLGWFDSEAVANSLHLYTRWVCQFGGNRGGSIAAKLTWRWSAKMALNAALVTAVFLAVV